MDRFTKKWIFILLFTVVAGLGISVAFTFMAEEKNEELAQKSKLVHYSSDEIYERIVSGLEAFENISFYDAVLNDRDIREAVRKVEFYHPEFFWLGSYTITTAGNDTILDFMGVGDYSDDAIKEMYATLIAAADRIIEQIPAGYNDYQKALFVHDYIVNNTRYSSEHAGKGVNGLWGTAYGCLVQGDAICQGYAEAYQLVLERAGIECGVCSGDSINGPHAWNYVRINGQYYWVDTTWDDPESESDEGTLRHNYFLINDELLKRTRAIEEGQVFVPSCSSMADNYHVRNGSYLEAFDINAIGNILAANASSRRAEMMFGSEEAYQEALERLFAESEIWSLSAYVSMNEQISYSNDDNMYILIIDF